MPSSGSKKVVYAGILANLGIAVCQYVAAGFTKSSAMTEQLESAIKGIEQRIRQQEPTIQQIFIEPDPQADEKHRRSEAA